MTDLDSFRDEVRRWIAERAPETLKGKRKDPQAFVDGGSKWTFAIPESKEWLRLCAERGFTAPTWPKEYGGGGYDRERGKVIREEIAAADLPSPLSSVNFGLYMIGPTLLELADEDIKREHLPKICRGEVRWCQGYSEPGSGSDLASVQTAAVLDGDHYVVNGQKVWTSYGDQADWMFFIARTDPEAKKQQGITFFLVDLKTPGITVKPIKLISGASPFCETFFEDVRVPRTQIVGELNAGWTVAKKLLEHERTMIGGGLGSETMLQGAVNPAEIVWRYLSFEGGQLADPILRDQLAQLAMDYYLYSFTTQRSRDRRKAGDPPGPESSLLKIFGTELNQRAEELNLRIRGPQSLGWEGPGFEADELRGTRSWLRSRGNTIEGGTSEIQRNIIAKRVLGLPD